MAEAPIILDTNIFIDHLRNFGPAVRFFESLISRSDVYFSVITETELLAGKINQDSEIREKLFQFLGCWNKINMDNPIASLAGDLCRDYSLDVPDAIIAATALINKSELITRNVKDYKSVPGLIVIAPY